MIGDKERIYAVKAWFADRNEIRPEDVLVEIKERTDNGWTGYHVAYTSPIRGDNDKVVWFPDDILNEFYQYLEANQ